MLFTILLIILLIPSLGIIVWFFVSTKLAFDKFNGLDKNTQEKLLQIDYYMRFVRELSNEELEKLGKLSDEEIREYKSTEDISNYIKKIKENRLDKNILRQKMGKGMENGRKINNNDTKYT
ncbi:hypothetical protein FACS189485_16920 [Spirochaetia bacterium]|nr:hypothetical protein FACS189485_16920 [Spirochaetia bacterium]